MRLFIEIKYLKIIYYFNLASNWFINKLAIFDLDYMIGNNIFYKYVINESKLLLMLTLKKVKL